MDRFLQNFKIVFFYELLTEKELNKLTELIENILKDNNIKTSKVITETNLDESALYQKVVNNSDKVINLENLNYTFKGYNINFSCNSKMFSIYFNKLANSKNIWNIFNVFYENFLKQEYLSIRNIYINKTISLLFADSKTMNKFTKLKIKLPKNFDVKHSIIETIDNYTEGTTNIEISKASLDNKEYLLYIVSFEIKKDLFLHKLFEKDIKQYLKDFNKLQDTLNKIYKEFFKEIKDEDIKNHHGIKILGE